MSTPAFATLFDKATIFDSIYQNVVVSICETSTGEFTIEVSASYNDIKEFALPAEAAQYISQRMRARKDYFKLYVGVNKVCCLLRDYAPPSSDLPNVKRHDKMLDCLSNFADYLKHYES